MNQQRDSTNVLTRPDGSILDLDQIVGRAHNDDGDDVTRPPGHALGLHDIRHLPDLGNYDDGAIGHPSTWPKASP